MNPSLHIDATGMCCSLGYSTAAASAAMRAGLDNFRNTEFVDFADKPLVGAMLDGLPPEDMLDRLSLMFDAVVQECMEQAQNRELATTPLLLLTAESGRPGLPHHWPQEVFTACTGQQSFHPSSRIFPWGKASLGLALGYAHTLLSNGTAQQVLIVGVDSYYDSTMLTNLLQQQRLITGYNSDGFHPGEGAGAVLVSLKKGPGLHVTGLGCAEETAHRLQNDVPNRAEGLVAAIRMAVAACGHPLAETYFHYSDCSGEAFYFREAAHALMRCLEHTIPKYPHLVTGISLGEVGAAIGPLLLAYCTRLLGRDDGLGTKALVHFSADNGKRAALIVEYRFE